VKLKTRNLSRQAGFSLLEAIMALVILSTAMGSLFSLINTDLISLRRAEAVVASQNVLEEAVRRMRLYDISASPTGRMTIGEHEVAWQARLVEPVAYGRAPRGAPGAYDHALYDVWLEVESQGRSLGRWHTRVSQYEFVRPPPDVPGV
jgi:general secretion pathway protein I